MKLEFAIDKNLSPNQVEKVCSDPGLQLTMKGSLKSLPANIHWHYKMPGQKGVLEITMLINEYKLLLDCKQNRMGEWINKASSEIKAALKLNQIKA